MSEFRGGTARALAVAVATVIGICAVLLIRDPHFFWVCDYQLWFTGIFEEVTRSWSEGEWPILSRGSWAVPSLAGEYQCGTFSVFFNVCLVLIWKLPLELAGKAATLSIVHLAFLAAGATLLARQREISPANSALVGVIAALNGWMMNWAATEWFVALSGFTWVPWTWWALERALATANLRARWVYPALFVYLTVSAGSPFAVLMMGLIIGWLMLRTLWSPPRLRGAVTVAFAFLAGLALSSPALLMLIEYHSLSTRSTWGLMTQTSWTVPAAAWLGLIQPGFITDWRHWIGTLNPHYCIEMAGGLLPCLAVLVCSIRERAAFLRRWKWELGLLALAVIVVSLPSYGSFRWSFRSMPLVHLVLAVIGAGSLDRLSIRVISLMTVVAATLFSAFTIAAGKNASLALVIVQIAILLVWAAAAWLRAGKHWTWSPFAVSSLLLVATYSCLSTHQSVSQHAFRDNLVSPAPLEPRRLYLSVHSFADILRGVDTPGWGTLLRPCNTMLCAPLRFLNGYTSFSVRGVPAFFETHGSLQPQTVDALLSPECSELLDLLGMDGLVFGPDYIDRTPLLGLEWQLAFASDEGTVFHREPARYAAAKTLRRIDSRPNELLSRPELELLKDGRSSVVLDIKALPKDSANVVPSLDSSRPMAIAFGRPYLPGYQATLNGMNIPVAAYQEMVPFVELPPNSSGKLVLSYRPDSLRAGLVIASAGLSLLIVIACWRGKRSL